MAYLGFHVICRFSWCDPPLPALLSSSLPALSPPSLPSLFFLLSLPVLSLPSLTCLLSPYPVSSLLVSSLLSLFIITRSPFVAGKLWEGPLSIARTLRLAEGPLLPPALLVQAPPQGPQTRLHTARASNGVRSYFVNASKDSLLTQVCPQGFQCPRSFCKMSPAL